MDNRTEFYFDGEPGDTEGCGPDPRKLIVVDYRAAAELAAHAEYLFNDAGDLIFAFVSDNADSAEGKTVERRYYYGAGGKLIRVIRGAQPAAQIVTSADLTSAREAQAETRRLRNLFALMFAE